MAEKRKVRPVNMSLEELDDDKAKKKAELFNKLWKIESKRGIAKFDSVEDMQLLIEDYFADCAEIGLRPTVRGLASALGTVYHTLQDWENGTRDKQLGSDCSATVKKAKQIIAQYDELMAVEGLDNPILFMFRAKNYYGMRDKQEIEVNSNTSGLDPELSVADIAQRLEQDIPIDADYTDIQ